MKFVRRELGPATEASSGGGERVLLREIILMVGGLLLLTLTCWFGAGWVTELALPLISIDQEKKWFGSFAPDALVSEINLPAPLAARFTRAQATLTRLQADPAVPRLDYRLFVLRDSDPNAFALPGGSIGITQGLLEVLEDDEVAVAFVLGHELGHFAHRDQLRGVGRQLGRSVAWSLIFGGDGSEMVTSHLSALLDLRHSRTQELSADLFGLELVARAYGTTAGTDALFVWLEKRDHDPAWLGMMATHPQPVDRLVRLRTHATQLTPRAGP